MVTRTKRPPKQTIKTEETDSFDSINFTQHQKLKHREKNINK